MFYEIKSRIEKYRSFKETAKKIRCVETGQIFESSRAASKWVKFVREIYICNMRSISQACRGGGQATSYGYHWEYVD